LRLTRLMGSFELPPVHDTGKVRADTWPFEGFNRGGRGALEDIYAILIRAFCDLVMQSDLPLMNAQRCGRIVNIASIGGKRGAP